jgi:protein O-GlcNAc transferase
VFCYALSPSDGSEWRSRIEAGAEHFVDVCSWCTADIAARIAADGIHIAVNLNGYTKGARNEIFPLRPAPVQCSYMGFPATMGADYLPYLISDPVVAPPHLHHCYSENLALMPHCYFINDYRQSHADLLDDRNLPRRADFGLPDDKVVYACSNQLYKCDPETFATWMRILTRVPNSVLWLLRFPAYGEPRMKEEAARHGVPLDRIIFTDVARKTVHIARSALADVFLDTPLCNAHTTGCDVLWGGVPIVTLPLERMASRVCASLCVATGHGAEMVVSSLAEYEERAVEYGLDDIKRLRLRAALKAARLESPLFDTRRWVRNLERVFAKMWAIHCSGEEPRWFQITEDDPLPGEGALHCGGGGGPVRLEKPGVEGVSGGSRGGLPNDAPATPHTPPQIERSPDRCDAGEGCDPGGGLVRQSSRRRGAHKRLLRETMDEGVGNGLGAAGDGQQCMHRPER